jgi:hypothetical protein
VYHGVLPKSGILYRNLREEKATMVDIAGKDRHSHAYEMCDIQTLPFEIGRKSLFSTDDSELPRRRIGRPW